MQSNKLTLVFFVLGAILIGLTTAPWAIAALLAGLALAAWLTWKPVRRAA